jgi:GTP-binding protein HflX
LSSPPNRNHGIKESGVLVSYPDSFTLEEAKGLVEASNRTIVGVFTQKYLNHSQFGIGSGKSEEIKQFVLEHKPDVLIIDEHLTSKQLYNLEKLTTIRVIDRERLILDIFYLRATTAEAKLQIELAEIQYQMPRVRETAKLSSGGERAGKGGMGEYVVDVRFRDLKRRISFIKDKLQDAQRRRELYHQQRMKAGTPVVSLVGYTSSGKTTLFTLLTGKDKEISNNLFTTVSTTTGLLHLDGNNSSKDVLTTDTVGFISRLPTYMIDAFKSTLEESLNADLILLLVDSSEDLQAIGIKYASCRQTLDQLKVDNTKVFVVFTKYDLIDGQKKLADTCQYLQLDNPIVISSKTGYGIHKLKNLILHQIFQMSSRN